MEKKIQFKGGTRDFFLSSVRERVENYFLSTKTPTTANWMVHFKTVTLLSTCFFLYLSLMNGWMPFFPRLLLWIVFGFNQALIAVNIGHDCLHDSYSKSRRFNKLLGYLAYDALGLSSCIWKQTHNQEHHTFTNIAGADPDINKPGILRLSPHDPYFSIHRFQYLYIWILYSMISLNWVFYSDYIHLWKYWKQIPKEEFLPFFGFKLLNFLVMFVGPLLWSPMSWQIVLFGYLLLHLTAGLTTAIIFQLAHVVENVAFPLPNKEGIIPQPWGTHEMETTSNFAIDSLFVTHLVGGLNFQIEHHLFPKISHCHYPQIAKIVQEIAKRYHLPYYTQPTMRSAIASHARFLKKLGLESSVKS